MSKSASPWRLADYRVAVGRGGSSSSSSRLTARRMKGNALLIKVAYEIVFDCPQPTPMILMVNVHYSRAADIVTADILTTDPATRVTAYRDGFGNWCSRIVAPTGKIRLQGTGVVRDSARSDASSPFAQQHALQDLPEDTLVFLLGSRYCETDLLSDTAWSRFGQSAPGWSRVQAICDFVHNHIVFNYQSARPTRTAWEAFNERTRSAGL